MSNITQENFSAFGKAAVSLDNDFAEFERLGGQIERLSVDSENELERAQQLLAKFGECGERIGTGMQDLAKSLEEARTRAEKAAQGVSARLPQIQERLKEHEQLKERLRALSEMVRGVSEAVGQLKKPAGEKFSDEEKALLSTQLKEFDSQLGGLVEQANKLHEDARNSKMKSLERNADSLSQTLQSARRKLSAFGR
jgi:chromosome segregation ATPase